MQTITSFAPHVLLRAALLILASLGLTAPAAAQGPAASPDLAPARYVLAHVDVETTGLDPAFHEMISIGMIYTDLEGVEIGRIDLRIMPPHPERIEAGARAVNGFDPALWRRQGAIDEGEAVRRIRAFHDAMRGDRTVIFTAYNVWFDQAFLTAMLRRQGSEWRDLYHYQVLDIPSMAWAMGWRQLGGTSLAAALGIPDETRVPTEHTGITGAAFNVSIYRALLARRKPA
ncbi:MAG TPA: 3'-5' exonuclease [Allosphingosinicella sp.]|jgi:DNA polymerase III epsilon subunit-like protein